MNADSASPWRQLAFVLPISAIVASCASTELNFNTLDLATTSSNLITGQVLYNLANFIDSNLTYPSQIVINSGSATTSNSIGASFSTPLSTAITDVTQIVRTVSAAPSTVLTGSRQGVTAGSSVGPSISDGRNQNWAYTPVTNAFQAARLTALYHFAVDNDETELRRNYPLLFQAVSHQRNICLTDNFGRPITVTYVPAKPDPTKPDAPPPPAQFKYTAFTRCLTSWAQGGSGNATISTSAGTDTFSTMRPDPYYLQGPNCVLCSSRHYRRSNSLEVNPRLKGGWLRWRALPGASGFRPDTYEPGDISLGQFGHYELFIDRNQQEKLPVFVVFILAASTQTDSGTAGSTGASQGGSGAGAKSAVQALFAPTNCQLDPITNLLTCNQ